MAARRYAAGFRSGSGGRLLPTSHSKPSTSSQRTYLTAVGTQAVCLRWFNFDERSAGKHGQVFGIFAALWIAAELIAQAIGFLKKAVENDGRGRLFQVKRGDDHEHPLPWLWSMT